MPDRISLKWRVALVFTLIVALILSAFAFSIYVVSKETQVSFFYERLMDRAKITAGLILEKDELDSASFKKIEQNFASTLPQEIIEVYNHKNQRVFVRTADADSRRSFSDTWLNQIRQSKEQNQMQVTPQDDQQVGIAYEDNQGSFVISVRAHDNSGLLKIERLKYLLFLSLVIAMGITLSGGWIFATQLLKPIHRLEKSLANITAHNLHDRIEEISKATEIKNLVTHINELLQRLESSFQAQKVFIANVSHEIRTPLSILLGELEIANLDDRIETRTARLESFRQEVIRLVRLSEQLLWLAHASRDKNEIYFSEVRIDEIIFEAVQSRRIEARKVNVNYSINPIDDSVLTVKGNADLLRALFINLIENALKYSEGEDVNVEIEGTEKEINVKIQDHGHGIPAGELNHIFKPFYRDALSNHKSGNGIGLYLCQQIATIHQATVTIDSTVGVGTCVCVTF
jgi:signal transduction histidine kinase